MSVDVHALPAGIVANAARLLGQPDAVEAVDPDHYTVASLRHAGQRVRVYRNGSRWRCSSDRRGNQDAPCAHILAVLGHKGLVALPSTGPKPDPAGVESEFERRANELVPTRLPELLAQLLAANPGEESPYSGYGRPPRPVYPQAFQAIARAAFQHSISGNLDVSSDRRHNPWGRVSRATLARFLDSPERSSYVQLLAEATVAPARASEPAAWPRRVLRFAKPDGTHLDMEVLAAPRYGLWLPMPGTSAASPDAPIRVVPWRSRTPWPNEPRRSASWSRTTSTASWSSNWRRGCGYSSTAPLSSRGRRRRSSVEVRLGPHRCCPLLA